MVLYSKYVLSFIFFVGYLGCSGIQGDKSAVSGGGISTLQFSDIPVPRKFSLIVDNYSSWGFRRGGFRVGKLVYVGRGSVGSIRKFYNVRLPVYGWTEEGQTSSKDTKFQKTWKKKVGVNLFNFLHVHYYANGGNVKVVLRLETLFLK